MASVYGPGMIVAVVDGDLVSRATARASATSNFIAGLVPVYADLAGLLRLYPRDDHSPRQVQVNPSPVTSVREDWMTRLATERVPPNRGFVPHLGSVRDLV